MAAVEVTGLVKRYAGRAVVDGVSFTVEEGEIFGILGPNGAGKTTTVECVSGLRQRDAGEVRVLGADPARDQAQLRRQVGVQLQHAELPGRMTVAEAMVLFAAFYPAPRDWRPMVEALGLAGSLGTRFEKLSGGQQQRLSIALAFVGDPRVAVLDELTTGLDPAARLDTYRLIEAERDRGVTVLLVTHLMPEAERLCDRLALIDHGHVVALDDPAGIVAQAAAVQRLRFRPSRSLDDSLLTTLPEVTAVERLGETVVVTGTADLVAAVTSALARNGVIAERLRIEQPSLDEAFVTLTGGTR